MGKKEKKDTMKQIRDEVRDLKESPLYGFRKENGYYPVLGEGNHGADIMFVGEAPGRNEAETGRPFCGTAGKILDELLSGIDLKREDVYITNIVKDRPEKNRDPNKDELDLYFPFLKRQVDIIEPAVLVPLGRFSMNYIMEAYGLEEKLAPIGEIHGTMYESNLLFGRVRIMPLYHPAVAIYDAKMKDVLLDDFKKLKKLIENEI